MSIISFNLDVLKPGSISFDLMGTSIETGRSMSGITGSMDYTAGGFWSVEYRNIFIETRDQHRYWAFLRNNLTGGSTNIDVQIEQRGSAPIPGSDEQVWSSFAEGGSMQFVAGAVTAFVASDASSGDGTVSLNMAESSGLIGGETFSVYHPDFGWRAYSISAIDSVVGTTYTVGIRPPLRGNILSGDICEFVKPKCNMRLMPGSKIPMEAKPPWHNPTAAIAFIETFNV